MQNELKELFLIKWKKYFGEAELPIVYYYTDTLSDNEIVNTRNNNRCLIGNLNTVRQGYTFVFSAESSGCMGGKRYTGYSQKLRPNFEYFLSCGIPGEIEGERYKKSSELVKEYLKNNPPFEAPAKYLVFKRWDNLEDRDEPLAVIFFATPDILSGLFTLANYDYANPNGVMSPMGSGCSSIIAYPLVESKQLNPRCVLAMFDVSARPFVTENTLTFTIPMKRTEEMLRNMDDSFLITGSWKAVRGRINK